MAFVLTVIFSTIGGYAIYWIVHRRHWYMHWYRRAYNQFTDKYWGYSDYESMLSGAKIKFVGASVLFSLLTLKCLLEQSGWEMTTLAICCQVGHLLGFIQFLRTPREHYLKSSLPVRRT